MSTTGGSLSNNSNNSSDWLSSPADLGVGQKTIDNYEGDDDVNVDVGPTSSKTQQQQPQHHLQLQQSQFCHPQQTDSTEYIT